MAESQQQSQAVQKFQKDLQEQQDRVKQLDQKIAQQEKRIQEARGSDKGTRNRLFNQLDQLTKQRGIEREKANKINKNLNRAEIGLRRIKQGEQSNAPKTGSEKASLLMQQQFFSQKSKQAQIEKLRKELNIPLVVKQGKELEFLQSQQKILKGQKNNTQDIVPSNIIKERNTGGGRVTELLSKQNERRNNSSSDRSFYSTSDNTSGNKGADQVFIPSIEESPESSKAGNFLREQRQKLEQFRKKQPVIAETGISLISFLESGESTAVGTYDLAKSGIKDPLGTLEAVGQGVKNQVVQLLDPIERSILVKQIYDNPGQAVGAVGFEFASGAVAGKITKEFLAVDDIPKTKGISSDIKVSGRTKQTIQTTGTTNPKVSTPSVGQVTLEFTERKKGISNIDIPTKVIQRTDGTIIKLQDLKNRIIKIIKKPSDDFTLVQVIKKGKVVSERKIKNAFDEIGLFSKEILSETKSPQITQISDNIVEQSIDAKKFLGVAGKQGKQELVGSLQEFTTTKSITKSFPEISEVTSAKVEKIKTLLSDTKKATSQVKSTDIIESQLSVSNNPLKYLDFDLQSVNKISRGPEINLLDRNLKSTIELENVITRKPIKSTLIEQTTDIFGEISVSNKPKNLFPKSKKAQIQLLKKEVTVDPLKSLSRKDLEIKLPSLVDDANKIKFRPVPILSIDKVLDKSEFVALDTTADTFLDDDVSSSFSPVFDVSIDLSQRQDIEFNRKTTPKQRQRQVPVQEIVNIPVQAEIIQPIDALNPDVRLPRSNLVTPLVPTPLLKLPKNNNKKQKQNVYQGFDTLVKEKGKLFKANKKPLTENEAYNLGADLVDNSVSAQFQIKKSSKNVTRDILIEKNRFFSDKFIAPKSKKKNTYIEKNTFRIDSQGELDGITAKGLLAKRNNSRNVRVTKSKVSANTFFDL